FENSLCDFSKKFFRSREFSMGSAGNVRMRPANSELSYDSAGSDSNPAITEIHAYLAARNLVLREAEENTTELNLRRGASGNELAQNCVHPARSPYEAQALPEAEAARERQHCQAVKLRLAEL